MRYAVAHGTRVEASPGARAECPTCTEPVLAKCGRIVQWHWAHLGRDDCDPWAEEQSDWHRQWQELFPRQMREVTMGPHRADLVAADQTVVELQHSHLSVDEIREREEFYGQQMIWVFDAIETYKQDRLVLWQKSTHHSFRWKHPRKSIWACRRPIFLDLGDERLLKIGKIRHETPCVGWGKIIRRDILVRAMTESQQAATA